MRNKIYLVKFFFVVSVVNAEGFFYPAVTVHKNCFGSVALDRLVATSLSFRFGPAVKLLVVPHVKHI